MAANVKQTAKMPYKLAGTVVQLGGPFPNSLIRRGCGILTCDSLREMRQAVMPVQAVIFATTRRTNGATNNTVGKATGHAVAKPLNQCVKNSASNP